MSRKPTRLLRTALIAAAVTSALATLAACNRNDDGRTVGQRVDATVAKAEQKAAEFKADANAAGQDAARATASTTEAVSGQVKDVAITAAVNAKLVADPGLSALRIDVDTVAGKVALRGTAPDAAARTRATSLAGSVDGVVGVDNHLVVSNK